METYLNEFLKFLNSINLTPVYPLIAPALFCVSFFILLCAGAIFKKIRAATKSAVTISAFSSYCLTLTKFSADALVGNLSLLTIKCGIVALALAAISFILAAALTLQNSFCKMREKAKKKTPENYFSDEPSPSIIPQAFAGNPFRRVEYLQTDKLWGAGKNFILLRKNKEKIDRYIRNRRARQNRGGRKKIFRPSHKRLRAAKFFG